MNRLPFRRHGAEDASDQCLERQCRGACLARKFERHSVIEALDALVITGRLMQSKSDQMTAEEVATLGKRVENHARYALEYLDHLLRMEALHGQHMPAGATGDSASALGLSLAHATQGATKS